MKSFIIAIILLAAVLTGVIVNIVIMCRVCDRLIALAEAMPDDSESLAGDDSALVRLGDEWHRVQKTARYFMDFREIDRADVAYTALENCWYAGEYGQYIVYLDEFIHAVRRMKEISEITPENIL